MFKSLYAGMHFLLGSTVLFMTVTSTVIENEAAMMKNSENVEIRLLRHRLPSSDPVQH